MNKILENEKKAKNKLKKAAEENSIKLFPF